MANDWSKPELEKLMQDEEDDSSSNVYTNNTFLLSEQENQNGTYQNGELEENEGSKRSFEEDNRNRTCQDGDLEGSKSSSRRPSGQKGRKRNHDEDFEVNGNRSKRQSIDARDDLNIFGRLVAAELRKVKDEKTVIKAQYEINTILYKAGMGKLKLDDSQPLTDSLSLDTHTLNNNLKKIREDIELKTINMSQTNEKQATD